MIKGGLETNIKCSIRCDLSRLRMYRLVNSSQWNMSEWLGWRTSWVSLHWIFDSKVLLLCSSIGNMPKVFVRDNDVQTIWNTLEVLEHNVCMTRKGLHKSTGEAKMSTTNLEMVILAALALTKLEKSVAKIRMVLTRTSLPPL